MDWFKYPVNEVHSYSKFFLDHHDLMRLGWVERVDARRRRHSISSEGFDALGDVDTVLTCNAFRDRVQEIGCLNERISGTAMRKHIYEFLTVAWENWINESFDCDYLLSGYPDNWDNMRSTLLN